MEAIEVWRRHVGEHRVIEREVRDSFVMSKKIGAREDGGGTEGWRKPKFGTLKVNCDGSWNSKTGLGSYEWVIRDFAGCLRRAGGAGKRPFNLTILAEVEAIRAALVFCKNEGFTKVEIESDAQVLLRMINKEIKVDADLECLLFDIDSLVKHIGDVKIGIVLRGSNLAAHTVTSFTAKHGGG